MSAPADSNSVEVRLPSRLGFEKVAMSTAASMAKLMGFADDRIEDLKTAVAEACINAIEHGNQMNASLPVGVILSMNPGELEVKVMDNGTGMNAAPPAARYRPQNERRRRSPRHGHVSHPGARRRSGMGASNGRRPKLRAARHPA